MIQRATRSVVPVVLALAALAAPGVASAKTVEVSAPSTPATQITAASARLTGILMSESVPSSFHVEIGRTTAYGFSSVEYVNVLPVPVQAWVTIYGTAPSTTYHFRFVATNHDGTTHGPDRTFTTLAASGTAPIEALSETQPPDPAPAPDPAPSDPLATPDLVPPLVPASGDGSPAAVSGSAPVLLPEAAESVVAGPVSGAVTFQAPGATSFTTLAGAAQIPVGSIVDARRGALEISADTGAHVDTGRFWGAVFRVSQPAGAGGAAELSLLGGRPARCSRAGGSARAASARGGGQGLWGKDSKGRFRTRGRNSVATVRGTVWYVGERCAGTVTRVLKGAVSVRDTRTGSTVLVKAGHHLMVRDSARSAKRAR